MEELDKNDTQNELDKLKTYALITNVMMIFAAMEFGTEKDFIRFALTDCLSEGIISAEASEHPIWAKLGMEIVESEPIPAYNPYKLLRYSDDNPEEEKPLGYWNFPLKRVKLLPGWTLHRGCGCGANLNPSSFTLRDDEGNVVETLYYFKNC
jgi:hypothetical protein